MAAAGLAALGMAAGPGCLGQEPGCEAEAFSLAAEAEAAFASSDLDSGRDLLRRARLLLAGTPEAALAGEAAVALSLRGADAAEADGDDEEAAQLLAEASVHAGDLLGPSERLLLARLAEARGDRRAAIFQYGHVLTAHSRRGDAAAPWVGERIRLLDAEEEARRLRVRAFPAPSSEAREAFASARELQRSGRSREAREGYRRALRLAPGYVEAAEALGSLEARAGRVPEAVAAYRTALASDPDSFEALVSLSNVLWAEPDRQAKEESLALLDRAVALRPDLPRLLREAAERWAEWGDAARALERLDRYRQAAPEDRAATDGLRARLALRLARAPSHATPELPDLSSPAIETYRLAQVWFRRGAGGAHPGADTPDGDEASRARCRELLELARRLDPTFAPAADLLASVEERDGNLSAAEAALRESLRLDPTRAATHERLAELLARQPGRENEARAAWTAAERAGSREALFFLAEAAAAGGIPFRAEGLYRRYLDESPDGLHAPEARAALARGAGQKRLAAVAGGAILLVAVGWASVAAARRFSGETLESWLRRDPARAREARRVVGRLRHEAFKHGGLLLSDAADRLRSKDTQVRRNAARLLADRLYGSSVSGSGPSGSEGRGLVAEAFRSCAELTALAAVSGFRLNLRHKDPRLARALAALDGLRPARRALESLATGEEPSPRRREAAVSALERASRVLTAGEGARLGRLLDEVSATSVSLAHLSRLLQQAAAPGPVPELVPLGLLGSEPAPGVRVRVVPGDWDTIWRNLFANAVAGGKARRRDGTASGTIASDAGVRLALHAEEDRDPVTGQALLRFALADDLPGTLTAEMIRGRAAERGLGVVADLVRQHDGLVDVGPPPPGAEGFRKAILLELPALEELDGGRG